MFQQDLQPVGDSLALSALCGALPLLALFVLLGGLRMKAWMAGLISLAVALLVAVTFFEMPVGQALLAGTEGAAFGFFPILWIVINAIWVYNLTVASGHFDVLRRSFEKVSPDQRVQAIIIAFCFGALLEALAGFGTPVAITVVMLMALGFQPMKAAVVALVANTAPVAFGALATPIVTLGTVTSGASDDPRLTTDTLGAMVGRQTPLLAVVVPLILVFIVDGRRGLRNAWLPAIICGVAFAVAQFVASNYISVPLTDIIASLVAAGAVVLLVRVWQPAEVLTAEPVDGPRARQRRRRRYVGTAVDAADNDLSDPDHHVDTRADVARAYAPYLVIIAIFSITNITAVKEQLAKEPWTKIFAWPGLDVLQPRGRPGRDHQLHPQLAAGRRHPDDPRRHHHRADPQGEARRGGAHLRQDLRRAEVRDRHRDGGARAGLRHEPLRPDRLARRLAGPGRQRLRDPVAHHRLARRRGHRLGHLVERAVRRPPGADGRLRPGSTRC